MITNKSSLKGIYGPSSQPSKWSDSNRWDKAATRYNDAVGRSSRMGAIRLIRLADTLLPLSTADARAIDFGAGTGSLTHQLAAEFPCLPILATDISPGMLEQLMALRPLPATSMVTCQVADMASPIGPEITEGAFSHVFSTMAIQVLPAPDKTGTLAQWARLLRPDGVIAIAMWDFDENCGPHALWAEAATTVDPGYVNPALVPSKAWRGCSDLERGLKATGFRDIKAEKLHIGFDVGKEGVMQFFGKVKTPWPKTVEKALQETWVKSRRKWRGC